ncbi:H/ACA ribonucleoprotein complex subunit 2-like protein [Panicum miliaceum]|uniref:H/ACA ribonucleoprotein complex subunit 2 n=1 Tax=Panicum miliaceum TaxID=4540 RepID=A0A3L6S3V1_PANMI|nr:H/ACA ribonucleoprotein complex subunit 2-like protein [Panicum miliaceum]
MGSDTEAEKPRAPVALAPIAKPLAGKKLCKRTLKLVRRASEAKCLKRGVKEVVKSIRRGNKGFRHPFFVSLVYPFSERRHNPYSTALDLVITRILFALLCVIAGNISPIDVITHVPILCEEANVPYVYVPSKEIFYRLELFERKDLATAGTTKRPTCCVLVMTKPAKGELEGEVKEKLKADYDQVTSEVAEVTSAMF